MKAAIVVGPAQKRVRDLYGFEREATFAGAGNKQRVFDNCMKARGYKEKQK